MSKKYFRDLATKFFSEQGSDKKQYDFLNVSEASDAPDHSYDSPSEEEMARLEKRLLLRINQEIDQEELQESLSGKNHRNERSRIIPIKVWERGVKVAAAIALVAGMGYIWSWYLRYVEPTPFQTIVYRNSSNLAEQFTLPDGSVVWLNNNTQIEVPEHFLAEKREVHLSGEAFFDVAKDPQRPFIIYSGNVITKVLGTSFNIKAYEGEDRVEVAVMSGKVAVNTIQSEAGGEEKVLESVELRPQERAVFSKSSQQLSKDIVQTEASLGAWKEERLLFEDVPVGEVINTLSHKHKVEIEAKNEALKSCRVNVDLTRHSVESTVRILCELINATYQREGDKFIISGAGCP